MRRYIGNILNNAKIIKLGDLKPTRDFLYVSDTVSAFVSALNSNKMNGETINIGSGSEISVKNLTQLILKAVNKSIKVKSEDVRKRPNRSEVKRLCCSNKKALKILKWKPRYHGNKGMILGLKETIDWFKIKENLRQYKSKKFVV